MEVRVSEEFNAPAEAVWRIVGAFHGLDRWFPGVDSCARDETAWGEVRLASLGGRVTPERLEAYDLAAMTCAWSLVDTPLLGPHRSTLRVSLISATRSRAVWLFTAEPLPPLNPLRIAENTARLYGAALASVENKSA